MTGFYNDTGIREMFDPSNYESIDNVLPFFGAHAEAFC